MPNPNGQNSVETLKRPTSTEITNNKRQKNELTVPQNSNDPLSSASTYSSSVSAVKNTLHGILDQVKLSILVLKEAIDKNYNFQLSTEMDAADKFDDIVLERQISSTQVESSCFQIKHHLKNKKIALAELFTPLENIDTTYSLQKYFFYYLKMKENEYFKNKVIRLFIMTTSSLDEDHLRKHLIRLKQTINPDFLASVNIENKIKSYQFELEDFDKNKLGQLLKSGSEFYQLARYLAAEVNSQLKINKNIKNYLFRKYNKALYTENIIDSKTNELHTSFFNNNLSPNIEEFKKLFIEYTNVDINTIKKNKFILPSVTNESKNQFPNQPNENDINDFLTKLIFCSDLPSEDSLDLPLQTYLGEYFSFIDSEFIADHIQSKMLNWLKTKGPKGQEGHYLTRVTGQDFLYEIQQHIDKLVLIGPTLEYKEKLNSGEIDFIGFLKNEKPYIDFLNDKSKKVLHIIAQKETFFSAIKV
ncbi:MAG: hypothetical protein REH83_03105, partial [Rickettsiella sp.]|nr:hypothetical protein [Rickettsiella sp.]